MKKISIKDLRKISQYSYLKNFWIDRFISIYFTKLFLILGISANQTTAFDLIVGIIGLFFVFLGGETNILIGSIFFLLFLIFDNVDGEIARYNKTISLKSYYIEGLCHPIMHPLKFAALGFGVATSLNEFFFIYNGLILMFLCSFEQAVSWRREIILGNSKKYSYTRSYEKLSKKLDLVLSYNKISNMIKYFSQESGMYVAIFFASLADFFFELTIVVFEIEFNFNGLLMLGYTMLLLILIIINLKNSCKIVAEYENNRK